MEKIILYDEAFEYEFGEKGTDFYFHIDYATRYSELNMDFPHYHQFYEIYVLLNGTSTHLIEGEAFELRPLDIVALNKLRLHKTAYHKGETCQRIILNFSYEAFSKYFPLAVQSYSSLFLEAQPIYRFDDHVKENLVNSLNKIFKLSKSISQINELFIANSFFEFLNLIYINKDSNRYTKNPLSNSADQKMYMIASYIHNHFSEDIGLEMLSNHFYLNPQYLSRQFKKTTGFTVTQYIQETRIKNAQVLLLDTNLKVTTIASSCGFGSLSQFNRVFKKICKISPTNFRKSQSFATLGENF